MRNTRPTTTPDASAERLHPESLRQLRQLIKLHGAPRLRAAIDQIEREDVTAPTGKYPGYRTMTGAQRRNARMERIFDEARKRGDWPEQS